MASLRIKWITLHILALTCLYLAESKGSDVKCPTHYCGHSYRCVVKENTRFCVKGKGVVADEIEEKCESLHCELPRRCYADLPICADNGPCREAEVVCRKPLGLTTEKGITTTTSKLASGKTSPKVGRTVGTTSKVKRGPRSTPGPGNKQKSTENRSIRRETKKVLRKLKHEENILKKEAALKKRKKKKKRKAPFAGKFSQGKKIGNMQTDNTNKTKNTLKTKSQGNNMMKKKNMTRAMMTKKDLGISVGKKKAVGKDEDEDEDEDEKEKDKPGDDKEDKEEDDDDDDEEDEKVGIRSPKAGKKFQKGWSKWHRFKHKGMGEGSSPKIGGHPRKMKTFSSTGQSVGKFTVSRVKVMKMLHDLGVSPVQFVPTRKGGAHKGQMKMMRGKIKIVKKDVVVKSGKGMNGGGPTPPGLGNGTDVGEPGPEGLGGSQLGNTHVMSPRRMSKAWNRTGSTPDSEAGAVPPEGGPGAPGPKTDGMKASGPGIRQGGRDVKYGAKHWSPGGRKSRKAGGADMGKVIKQRKGRSRMKNPGMSGTTAKPGANWGINLDVGESRTTTLVSQEPRSTTVATGTKTTKEPSQMSTPWSGAGSSKPGSSGNLAMSTKFPRHPPSVRRHPVEHSYKPPDWMPDLQGHDIEDPCEAKRCRPGEVCHIVRVHCKERPCKERAVCSQRNPCRNVQCAPGSTCHVRRRHCQNAPCDFHPVCERTDLCKKKKCAGDLICKTKRSKNCNGTKSCAKIAYCATPKTCMEMKCPPKKVCRMNDVICFAPPCQNSGPQCVDQEKSLNWHTIPTP